jgi:hypothetical protein
VQKPSRCESRFGRCSYSACARAWRAATSWRPPTPSSTPHVLGPTPRPVGDDFIGLDEGRRGRADERASFGCTSHRRHAIEGAPIHWRPTTLTIRQSAGKAAARLAERFVVLDHQRHSTSRNLLGLYAADPPRSSPATAYVCAARSFDRSRWSSSKVLSGSPADARRCTPAGAARRAATAPATCATDVYLAVARCCSTQAGTQADDHWRTADDHHEHPRPDRGRGSRVRSCSA